VNVTFNCDRFLAECTLPRSAPLDVGIYQFAIATMCELERNENQLFQREVLTWILYLLMQLSRMLLFPALLLLTNGMRRNLDGKAERQVPVSEDGQVTFNVEEWCKKRERLEILNQRVGWCFVFSAFICGVVSLVVASNFTSLLNG
jgi:hypothetical protein